MIKKLLACVLFLVVAAPVSAQFTIPNNNQASNPTQSLWMQADVDTLVAGIRSNGVWTGLAVTPSSGTTLNVAKGSLQYAGVTVSVAAGTVSLAVGGSKQRLDLVVVSNTGVKSVVQGVGSNTPAAPAVPANSIMIAMVYVPAGDSVIGSEQITDKRVLLGDLFSVFRVTDYGAVCDGSTDNSTALTAAFAAATAAGGGTVLLPVGVCSFASPLTIGGSTLDYARVNLLGQGIDVSFLTYTGPDTQTAITLSRVAYFFWKDLQVKRSGTVNTTVGVKLTGPFHGAGTQTLFGLFQGVRFQGFHIGVLAGDGSSGEDEASEIQWVKCIFSGNDIGWTDSGFNSLNFTLRNVSIGGNQIGVSIGGIAPFGGWVGGGIVIDGADSVANTIADIQLGNTFGHTVVRNVRTESQVPLLKGQYDTLTVEDNDYTYNAGTALQIAGNGYAEIKRNSFNSPIKLSGNFGSGEILVEGNLTAEGTAGYPVDISGVSLGQAQGQRMTLKNNRKLFMSGNAGFFADRDGWFMGGGFSPLWVPMETDNGGIGVGKNYDFTRSLGFGSQVVGKNLRDRVKFATSATAAYTFVKTPTVSITSGSRTFTFTAGLITDADIGKRISLANATSNCNPPGLGAVVGFIDTVPSATSATIIPTPLNAGATCAFGDITQTGSVTATIGENEPDAKYFLMMGCDTNGETIKWGSKATTGFTLTSSNASSTASCDVLIVR